MASRARIGSGLLRHRRSAAMAEFTRQEIEAAFQQKLALQEKDDWLGFGNTFTDDAVYVEHHEGTFVGRPRILEWLLPVMERCRGWTYPIDWVAIDGNRLIYRWRNRLPGPHPDGTHYEFAGISVTEYAGGGRWSYQEDVYNWEKALEVLKDWAQARKRQ
jgi:SnoaL-like domain